MRSIAELIRRLEQTIMTESIRSIRFLRELRKRENVWDVALVNDSSEPQKRYRYKISLFDKVKKFSADLFFLLTRYGNEKRNSESDSDTRCKQQ